MPSPTETLLRVQDSPVPTQTVLGFARSTATAPIDWLCLSNTGFQVTPPSDDRHRPPPAAPTKIVRRSVSTASIAAIRPLIAAGPIARAARPPKTSESSRTSSAGQAAAGTSAAARTRTRTETGSPPSDIDPSRIRFPNERTAESLLGRGRRLRLLGRRHRELGVVDRSVELDLAERQLLPHRHALGPLVERVGEHQSADFLVIADRALGVHLHPLDLPPALVRISRKLSASMKM